MNKLRKWLIIKLIGKATVEMNMHIDDNDKHMNSFYRHIDITD